MKPDPERAPFVKKAFQLYLTGTYNVVQLSNTLYAEGLRGIHGKKVSPSQWAKALRNPIYYGDMRWKGVVKEGKHEGIITRNQFEAINSIMNKTIHYVLNKHYSRTRLNAILLRGFVYCGICGDRYIADVNKKRGNKYFHCSDRKKHSNVGQHITVEALDTLVENLISELKFSDTFIDLIIKKAKRYYDTRISMNDKLKRGLVNKKNALENKRIVAEEKLLTGVFSNEEYIAIRDRITEALIEIDEGVEDLGLEREIKVDVVQNALNIARNLSKAYIEADIGLKKIYLALFVDKIYVKDKMIVKIDRTPLTNFLSVKRAKSKYQPFSPDMFTRGKADK